MPLPAPILDDRSYRQLRDELLRRIPVYAPEWTDHNASDPGIALLELFSFLGESLLFRFNQIPDATRMAFLRLLDVPLRPATAARGMLALTTKEAAGRLVEAGTEAKAGTVPFETRTEVVAWPLALLGVARIQSEPPDEEDEEASEFADRAIEALGELEEGEAVAFYTVHTLPADPAVPGAEPVDLAGAVDDSLWLAVLGTKDTNRAELLDGVLNVGFLPDLPVDDLESVLACPGAGAAAASSPACVWQVSTTRTDATGAPVYVPLKVEGDTTRGLTREGTVRVRLPRMPEDMGVPVPASADLAGARGFPPELEDEEAAASVLFWLRAFRIDASALPAVLWVGANATEVEQTRRAAPEYLGTGTGEADQRYGVVHRPVIAGSLLVEIEEPGGWTPWTPVDDLQAVGEDGRCYVLDREAGEVRFGDGVRGRAPQIGERIRATSYRYGGGEQGNVAAAAITKVDGVAGVKASNPLPTRGGAASEALADALERVPGELRRRDRAVTADDFRELALATPGAEVGRAECLPRFHPRQRDVDAAGCVSVVVWPRQDRVHPNAPIPDRTLLRCVCSWLDERRLVTTELYVIPPTYRTVAVAVGLAVKPGYGVEAVRRWVELVLRQYLAPLPPYGPSGEGWPLGRRVHGPELEAAALQVEGVEFLEGLELAEQGADGAWTPTTTVQLERWEVPTLAEITVVAGPPLEPGSQPEPPAGDVPVPVPVIRETC
jgi:predicted phage baseplate assembly protein